MAKKRVAEPAPIPAAGAATAPRARVRMYRHGLGDCLYLEFPRADEPYRIMIDCGLVLGAQRQVETITEIMDHVVEEVGNSGLDLLVVTHPHWDHVSGFVQAKASFATLPVRDVWMGWTEDPKDALAVKLKSTFAVAEATLRTGLHATAALGMGQVGADVASLLSFLGDEALGANKQGSTADAVATAAAKAQEGEGVLRFCLPGEAPFLIPGTTARVFVLGPPGDEAELRKMDPTARTPETYSLTALNSFLHLGGAFRAHSRADRPDAAAGDDGRPFADRFAIPLNRARTIPFFCDHYWAEGDDWQRIDTDWAEEITSLALLLDRAVNNSSLALAIELEPGGDVILLAADAQVGNWLSWLTLKWTLPDREVTGPDLIARTVAYKVGHHASLNATLREHGVEKMARLKYSLIPVNAAQAAAKGWGHNIPIGSLLTALARGGNAVVLRSDENWTGADLIVETKPLYHQLNL